MGLHCLGLTPANRLQRWSVALTLLSLGLWLVLPTAARAEPYRPGSDAEVLERLPLRAADASSRERLALRQRLRSNPRDAEAAATLAQSHLDELAAEGDPRQAGYAQAALRPWWNEAAPPADLRVQRAVLRQFGHDFEPALADLRAVVADNPSHAQAWAWIAAISLVMARFDDARAACTSLKPHASALLASACDAGILSTTGQAAAAASQLKAALATPAAQVATDERLWALTRLAEALERAGQAPQAEAAFREALALPRKDQYLRAAHADFLLDQGRPAEVLKALADASASDVLLLRLALAAKAANDPSLPRWRDALAARFQAAAQRGDTTHRKEQARFMLQVLGDAAGALPLAQQNFAQQKELADARLLLEAALAARQRSAAEPALRWLADSRAEHPRLRALEQALKALP